MFEVPGVPPETVPTIARGATARPAEPPRAPAAARLAPDRTDNGKSIGQLISESTGFDTLRLQALQNRKNVPEPLPKQPNLLQLSAQCIAKRPDIAFAVLSKPSVAENARELASDSAQSAAKTSTRPEFAEQSHAKQQAQLLSHAGVGAGKLAQIFASDESLSLAVRSVLEELKSGGAPTRTLDEAQNEVNQSYGSGRYTVTRPAGVGTIGEVYHAVRTSDGKPVVVKMLKSTVSTASLEKELAVAKELTALCFPTESRRAYKAAQVESAYRQWQSELDFSAEAENAKLLVQDAKTYSVAQPLAIGRDATGRATSLVFEKANGVALDKLSEMLGSFNENPGFYHKKYASAIAEHPWLAHPDSWKGELPGMYRNAMNEQTMLRTPSAGISASHGDPHTGNVFMNIDPQTGKPELTFIDTGLVVSRSGEEIAKNTALSVSMLTGDAKTLASQLLDLSVAPMDARTRAAKQQWIENEVNSRLFKANVDITNSRYNGDLMNHILEEMRLRIAEKDLTFVKSQFQTVSTYRDLNALAGKHEQSYVMDSLPDIGRGVMQLLWNQPTAAVQYLSPNVAHIMQNSGNAALSALQFILPRSDTPKS